MSNAIELTCHSCYGILRLTERPKETKGNCPYCGVIIDLNHYLPDNVKDNLDAMPAKSVPSQQNKEAAQAPAAQENPAKSTEQEAAQADLKAAQEKVAQLEAQQAKAAQQAEQVKAQAAQQQATQEKAAQQQAAQQKAAQQQAAQAKAVKQQQAEEATASAPEEDKAYLEKLQKMEANLENLLTRL